MRRTRRWLGTIAVAVTLGNRPAHAQLSSNAIAAASKIVDARVRRVQQIQDEVVKLEEAAPADRVDLVDCIHSRVLKIKGLLELTFGAQQSIHEMVRTDTAETLNGYVTNVTLCCERAEKLLLEADDCAINVNRKAVTSNEVPASVTNAAGADFRIVPRTGGIPPVHRPVVRSRETCLRHEQFAVMLGKAMDLKMTDKVAPADYMKALTRLAVEPLHGWQPGQCVTVDDVYVACARAMGVKVKDSKDPLSYGEALRQEGLGVDTLLPERDPQLDPPYVLESEVRALLTTGYAAPLPSSKPVDPD
jgi:hypothetical protein